MGGDAQVGLAGGHVSVDESLHQLDVVGINIGFAGEGDFGRLFVSAFAQPDKRALGLEVGHVLLAAVEISLDHGANVITAKGVVHLAEDTQSGVGVFVALHVDGDMVAELPGVFDNASEIEEAGVFRDIQAKLGELEGYCRLEVVAGDSVQDADVLVGGFAGILGGCHRLAQVVQRNYQPVGVELLDDRHRFRQRLAGDETPGHAPGDKEPGDQRLRPAGPGKVQQDGT